MTRPQTMTVKELVRLINARTEYTYYPDGGAKVRVVEARTRKNSIGDMFFQVRELSTGKWITGDPSEIIIERA